MRSAIEAGQQVGLDTSAARVLRVRSSVHVELPRAGVVARVEGPGDEEIARRQVDAARVFADHGAPVAELVRPEVQPLLIEGCAVTLWRRLRAIGRPSPETLGRATRAIHEATRSSPPPDLPSLDPFGRIYEHLAWPSLWSGSDELGALRDKADEFVVAWREAIHGDPLGRVLLHGDVHADNAVMTERGLILIDLEDTAVGPASWDFVPLAVGVDRYGVPSADYRDFVAGYGAEPGNWAGHELMCRVYELAVTAWAIRCSGDSEQMAKEASVRVATLLGRGREPWTLL